MWNFFVVAFLVGVTPTKHPYTVKDQVALNRILDFNLASEKRRIVFTLRRTDIDANKGRTNLWLVNMNGTGLRQLTASNANDSQAKWAPDGVTIYFLSNRSGTSQVWKIRADGGEAVQVTTSPVDIKAFTLSRDGNQLALAATVFPSCATLTCTKKRLDAQAKRKATGRIYTALLYRHWDSWRNGRRVHLFVQPVTGGTPIDVMEKLNADAPPLPFSGAEEFTFTPDGKGLVFTLRHGGTNEAWSTNLDIFFAPTDGKRKPRNLTQHNAATDMMPTFSPDGKQLAWLALKRPGFESDSRRIMLRSWPKGKPRALVPSWDRSAATLSWTPDSKHLVVTAQNLGQRSIFSIDVDKNRVREIFSHGTVSSVEVTAQRLVFTHDSLTSASDIYTLPHSGSDSLTPVTQVNAKAFASLSLGTPEQFSFTGANGDTVYGYIVKPVNLSARKKYPLAFLIHGGPQGSFSNHWHYRWNPQTYAGAGYAVVMIDFHGSTGYGQAFTDSISGDWGGKPLEDLQKGLKVALAKYPFIDAQRMCALGASYGGYMVNWIAGNWNEPWKCLVNHDGNLDARFAYYDTDELWFPEWEHGGTPWENPSGYAKHNPIDYVARWKVPMLVVHGAKDFRVVEAHSMAVFTALQRKGIPSQFLYFPDENHWVLKPANSIQWHETVLHWLDKWTKHAK